MDGRKCCLTCRHNENTGKDVFFTCWFHPASYDYSVEISKPNLYYCPEYFSIDDKVCDVCSYYRNGEGCFNEHKAIVANKEGSGIYIKPWNPKNPRTYGCQFFNERNQWQS